MKSKFVACVAVAAASLWFGQAEAASYNLNLSGSVGSAAPFSLPNPSTHTLYQGETIWSLSGLNAFDVSQGDQIHASVTLDAPWNVPASVNYTSVTLTLYFSASTPLTYASGTTTLYNSGAPVISQTGFDSLYSAVGLGPVLLPPNNGAFAFDSGTFDFTINTLGSTQTVTAAALDYTLAGPYSVPEPATWVMLVAGLGGVGAAMRSRRKTGAALATA